MEKGFRLLVAFVGVWAARGQEQVGAFDPARHVNICLEGNADIQARWALEKEEAIFAPAGINVTYYRHGVCPLQAGTIRIDFRNNVPDNFHPGALAYAYPFEGTHIVILLDRAEALAHKEYRGPVADLLAYVIAHEIAHVLEATGEHSASGIMKAVWGTDEYAKIRLHKLTWEPGDIRMIQMGMARRTRLAARDHQPDTANR